MSTKETEPIVEGLLRQLTLREMLSHLSGRDRWSRLRAARIIPFYSEKKKVP